MPRMDDGPKSAPQTAIGNYYEYHGGGGGGALVTVAAGRMALADETPVIHTSTGGVAHSRPPH